MGIDLRIGLIGCGTIGTRIAMGIDTGQISATLSCVVDINQEKAEDLVQDLKCQSPKILDIDGVWGEANLVVEAASASLVPELLSMAVKHRIDCLILSVGGLLGEDELIKAAKEAGIKIYCPSGAIAGLDAVATAALGRVDSVRLTTRKPPQGLKGAPYVLENQIKLDGLEEEMTIFEGNALSACKAFPKNINVAAALSLAGIGPERTMVRIIADSKATRNSHQIEVVGEFGNLLTRTENLPSPFNPKTSYLAALSAVACLKRITSSLILGS